MDAFNKAYMAIAFLAWCSAIFFMFRVAIHASRLKHPPLMIKVNPFNLLARPDLWTAEARSDSLRCYASFVLFIVLVVLGIMFLSRPGPAR